ncbi:MAG: hypothetical protein WC479_11875 [Candidatus Izemoplasmatales bacterium]|jgi:hypothetical protein
MTRLQFYSYIVEIFKRTDKSTEIYRALNETITDIANRYPFENYSFQSWIPCVVGQEDYPLPSTLVHISHPIRLLEGSAATDDGFPLDFITKQEYDALEANPNRTSPETGEPAKYTIFSDSILLTPIPDSTDYLIEINWGKQATALSVDSDTASFISAWDEIIKWGTLFRVYLGLGLTEDATPWQALYEQGINRMIDRDKDKKNSWIGRVQNNNL